MQLTPPPSLNVERPNVNKRVRLNPQTENLISNSRALTSITIPSIRAPPSNSNSMATSFANMPVPALVSVLNTSLPTLPSPPITQTATTQPLNSFPMILSPAASPPLNQTPVRPVQKRVRTNLTESVTVHANNILPSSVNPAEINEVVRSGDQVTTAPRVNQSRRSNTRVNNAVNSGPIFEQFSTIMLRYIDSTKTINTIFSKIESIPDNGHIYWSELIRSISFALRPNQELRQQMMEELQAVGVISVTKDLNNNNQIKKGSLFTN